MFAFVQFFCLKLSLLDSITAQLALPDNTSHDIHAISTPQRPLIYQMCRFSDANCNHRCATRTKNLALNKKQVAGATMAQSATAACAMDATDALALLQQECEQLKQQRTQVGADAAALKAQGYELTKRIALNEEQQYVARLRDDPEIWPLFAGAEPALSATEIQVAGAALRRAHGPRSDLLREILELRSRCGGSLTRAESVVLESNPPFFQTRVWIGEWMHRICARTEGSQFMETASFRT